MAILGLHGSVACGAEDPASAEGGIGREAPPLDRSTISAQTSAACVALPELAPRAPMLSVEAGCSVAAFEAPDATGMAADADARALLVGRWQLCGGSADYGEQPHEGLEFGSNGRNQLLRSSMGGLVPVSDGARGVYTLLGSGEFMQFRGLSFGGIGASARFDATLSVLRLAPGVGQSGVSLQYVRVVPDERSAAANVFSTATTRCSMVGVWDTAIPSDNPAAFAFDDQGEWFGGEWGSDLCAAHTMYGTYDVDAPPNPMDNFDFPTFAIISHIDASSCAFWRGASFLPVFGDDCNSISLELSSDGCNGSRGYLQWPGEALIRRVP